VSNRTWETRPSGIIGGLGNRSHGGTVNPLRNRKGWAGNPPPTAGAPELHPDRALRSTAPVLDSTGRTYGAPAPVLDPTTRSATEGDPYRHLFDPVLEIGARAS